MAVKTQGYVRRFAPSSPWATVVTPFQGFNYQILLDNQKIINLYQYEILHIFFNPILNTLPFGDVYTIINFKIKKWSILHMYI